ncbi:MAG: 23S rRNA (uracil(1939)-C(5))-methyltransferase RlmD [Acholeplasma sp.]|nr:23S rRNA (uracil(1939)-C(5))-methyltransferase RlmD [Acholeplasma sp.]
MRFNIVRVGNDAEGIAYYKDKPVFIYYGYKGEEVEAELVVNKRGAYEGEIKSVISPSKHRVAPLCPYYGVCGGCNLMHISYEESLRHKRSVIDFLVKTKLKIEYKDIVINNTHGSVDTFNYRNKINVPVKIIDGKNAIGLFYRGSNQFLPIEKCIIEDDNLNVLAKEVLKVMDQLKIKAYDAKSNTGHVTNLSIRTNLEGQMQLTFVIKNKVNLDKAAELLMKKNSNLVSVYESFIPTYKTNRDMFNGTLTLIKGSKELVMKLNEFKFLVTPNAFFQLNSKQAIKLYELVIKKANFSKDDVVLDAYSGVGTIATFISPHVKEVVAIESIKAAVNAMDESNRINGITNMKTITGDVVKVTDYLKKKFDVMVFDPPRTGLGETIINYILKNLPKRVVYVSCNPETLVVDLKGLSSKYKIVSIDPFDMFPQTSQVESVTLLELKS